MNVNQCVVCDNIVGEAHKCEVCNKYVHLICGDPTGEEGFGQKVVCNKCKSIGKGKTVFPFIFFIL